jgi:hypothetical protein
MARSSIPDWRKRLCVGSEQDVEGITIAASAKFHDGEDDCDGDDDFSQEGHGQHPLPCFHALIVELKYGRIMAALWFSYKERLFM